ncbi:unnamed protein product [Owenia fusiformis]|uniref:Large ribosomal subunit protein uL18m n=1 Tax=Owenia fusiformis TaxID=6347 RepID=A0A8J1TKF6_OWEFU|nr:unnamed protein product [Owenia fusiformis]
MARNPSHISRLLTTVLTKSNITNRRVLCRGIHLTTTQLKDGSSNEQITINPNYENRNPRNLELMGYARKSKGWRFQYPDREYYHRLVYERTKNYITASVEHCTNGIVISASTKEHAIRKHLYSAIDASAAENVGHVLAERCKRCGVDSMVPHIHPDKLSGERVQSFLTALQEGGVTLSETPTYEKPYESGIDYDRPSDKEPRWKVLEKQAKDGQELRNELLKNKAT